MTTTLRTMLDHIGPMNVLAISGGRVQALDESTILLPVRYGYRVRVRYVPGVDLYDVERVLIRAGRMTVKGTESHLYADQVGDSAYRASCYMDSFGEHDRD